MLGGVPTCRQRSNLARLQDHKCLFYTKECAAMRRGSARDRLGAFSGDRFTPGMLGETALTLVSRFVSLNREEHRMHNTH
eukprot:8722186-Pyramimonas_sp.AAC.1